MAKGIKAPGWWGQRSLREKQLLLVAGALVVLVAVWFLAIQPLMDARSHARVRMDTAITELAKARANAATAQVETGAPQVPLPLQAFVTQGAAEQGFTNMNVTASSPNQAAISSPQVRPQVFFGWIAQMEARGVVVESLSARANSDQTIAVDATLRAGGQ